MLNLAAGKDVDAPGSPFWDADGDFDVLNIEYPNEHGLYDGGLGAATGALVGNGAGAGSDTSDSNSDNAGELISSYSHSTVQRFGPGARARRGRHADRVGHARQACGARRGRQARPQEHRPRALNDIYSIQ